MSGEDETQRSLGRIEGAQGEILKAQHALFKALEALSNRVAEHVQKDQLEFSASRNLAYQLRDELKTQFEAQAISRDEHLDAQDLKLNALMTARAVLLGQLTMGQRIVAAIGAVALFAVTIYEAWRKFH